ncbi:MAG: protein-L-isoaspartate(D-aspartate) O-methyltransferase [Chloroflexi bacterium]|nr:protein-L-isoaspartate(D-aspartate) O-methyltransferase [Chloroflexota bacterium]
MEHARARETLVETLRKQGISDERVLRAFLTVDRSAFVPDRLRAEAYANQPLPIGQGQTISQPMVVALTLQAAVLQPTDSVLEIGTGSGYQTALLSVLVARVESVERLPELASQASERLQKLQCTNVRVHVGDGTLGWSEGAPYDAIVVSAASPYVPRPLSDQLNDGGRLVIPVGGRTDQELLRLVRHGEQIEQQKLGPVRFVPLIGREGWYGAMQSN